MVRAGTAEGSKDGGPPPEVLARIRATVEREPELWHRAEPWRVQPLSWLTVWLAVLGVAGGWLARVGALTRERFLARVFTLGLLGLTAVGASVAASGPWPGRVRSGALCLGMSAALVLVLSRLGAGAGALAEGWRCTLVELGAGVVPFAMMVSVLREHAMDWQVGAAWGLAVGCTGAVVGELGCGGGWLHLLVFHLSAWMLYVAAGVGLARKLRPKTYAP